MPRGEDENELRIFSNQTRDVYGTYGISVFAVRGLSLDEMVQQVPLAGCPHRVMTNPYYDG